MKAPGSEKNRRGAWLWSSALVVFGALALWMLVGNEPPPEDTLRSWEAKRPGVVIAPAQAVSLAPPKLAGIGEDLPIMPHGPRDPVPDGPVHPHPITPAHARIYRENNLIGALNGAVDVKDAAGIRRVLASYRAEYPEDPHALQEGYEIIADCLEHPGQASSDVARRYYDAETASTLRRYVRRHCLER